ncbi:COP9 signalosome complex subunit 4 [Hibiscus syriacus]|uniref:COP9 signalosome complex subunit 4 n=1 Tax=Hibiscus syriacus TaxID=106335 RepID=A0A6A2YAZ7_HIBSY|nr:COP9 signalosome complex subunit 4 [Hibiscus syriacus]
MLSGIDLDSGMRQFGRDDDAVNAEAFINKASFLISNRQYEMLVLHYKVGYARILDIKRKFLEAALRYYDISQIEKRKIGDENLDLAIVFSLKIIMLCLAVLLPASLIIDEDELEQALSAAVTCTILAAAGPQRSRLLSILYNDKRCSKLKIYPTLQKVLLIYPTYKMTGLFGEDLRKPEIDAFAEELKPHQWKRLYILKMTRRSCNSGINSWGMSSSERYTRWHGKDGMAVLSDQLHFNKDKKMMDSAFSLEENCSSPVNLR